MANTTHNGAQAVKGPSGLIIGIDCSIPIIRKYTLANRLNCSNSDSIFIDEWYLEWNHTNDI